MAASYVLLSCPDYPARRETLRRAGEELRTDETSQCTLARSRWFREDGAGCHYGTRLELPLYQVNLAGINGWIQRSREDQRTQQDLLRQLQKSHQRDCY
jgi:hypothetical protein